MHRLHLAGLLVAVFACLFVAKAASGQSYTFEVNMDPFQEVPPHNTPGYGAAEFSLNASTLVLTVTSGNYADLLAGATTVRIADGAVGTNGPTQFVLTLDTPGNTSGTFSGSGTLANNTVYDDALDGNLYVNITDSVFPSGEIRGQLQQVPEPASAGLIAVGLGYAALRRRRKC